MDEAPPLPSRDFGLGTSKRIKEHWLTRKPNAQAWWTMLALFFILYGIQAIYESQLWANLVLSASPEQVFQNHEYWRLWTALFVHADFGHIASNSLLFFPLAYYLYGYYGFWLFPFSGILLGGLTNIFVLMGMPAQVNLLGISGVVYWMGATWLTLYLLIERRDSWRRRVAKVVMLTAVLLVPETYRPEVSYMSHFLGYIVGIATGLVWYGLNRKKFLAAEVYEQVIENSFEEIKPISTLSEAE